MTLVAGLSVGGLPAFVGDLLISWRVPSKIDLPTQAEPAVHTGVNASNAAGLAQKLIIVRPYLLIAWAGRQSEVVRLVRQLDAALPATMIELKDPDLALRILDTCSDGVELIALLNLGDGIYPFCVRTRGFELDDKRIYLLGTGADNFFSYLQDHPQILPGQSEQGDQIAQAIMLRFAARAAAFQWICGAGLEASWGGGFEVAYPERDGFKKINNVLFRAWMIEEDGSFHNSGRSFFSKYYGRNLHINCFHTQEKTYVVPCPLGDEMPSPDFEQVHPEWTVDVFVLRKTASLVEFARYHPPNRPVADFFQMARGALVGWSMDQEYVENCVEVAIAAASRGNTFELTRY